MDENKSAPNGAAENVEQLAAERRAALKKLGRFVAIELEVEVGRVLERLRGLAHLAHRLVER